jgi:hypothetical protein
LTAGSSSDPSRRNGVTNAVPTPVNGRRMEGILGNAKCKIQNANTTSGVVCILHFEF